MRAAALCLLLASAGCRPAPDGVRVFAAASVHDAVAAWAERTGTPLRLSGGPSSVLARQIRAGAPADVFVSADRAWLEWLRAADCLGGEPARIARNTVVCIARPRSPLADAGISGPAALADALGKGALVGVGDEGVPVGDYARAALGAAGQLQRLAPRMVGLRDVRAVAVAVRDAHVDAGFVYRSELRSGGVAELFELVMPDTADVALWAVPLAGSAPAAAAVVDALTGPPAREVLAEFGFALP